MVVVSGRDLDELYQQQQQFRASEQAAVTEAVEAPIEQARAQLAELAAKQQAWLDEQKRMLRDRSRQHAQTGRAADQLARVGRDANRGWSL